MNVVSQRQEVLSQQPNEPQYRLSYPLNMTRTLFLSQSLREALRQAMPCDITFEIIQQDFSGTVTGSGTYMKDAKTRKFALLSEEGACINLLQRLGLQSLPGNSSPGEVFLDRSSDEQALDPAGQRYKREQRQKCESTSSQKTPIGHGEGER